MEPLHFLLRHIVVETGPHRRDMLRMGLAFPFLTTTPKGFILKPGTGGVSKGPATYPFLIHVAIVSVRIWPYVPVLAAFLVLIGGKGDL